jgi:FkbM family methyltransferase
MVRLKNGFRRFLIKSKNLSGRPYSKADFDHIYFNDLRRSGSFVRVEERDAGVLVTTHCGRSLTARLYPHSDCFTLKQIFIDREYQPLVSMFRANKLPVERLKVIDAGANVGYTSAFLLSHFPDAEIACIEPEGGNLRLLEQNLDESIRAGQVVTYNMGLMDKNGVSLSIDRTFRDGKDHSVSVFESEGGQGIESITVERIMDERGWESLDILKVDIEGAERFVFGEGADTGFLTKVRSAAIEIHDEFDIRDEVYSVLRRYGFVLFNSSETTFGLNISNLQ